MFAFINANVRKMKIYNIIVERVERERACLFGFLVMQFVMGKLG